MSNGTTQKSKSKPPPPATPPAQPSPKQLQRIERIAADVAAKTVAAMSAASSPQPAAAHAKNNSPKPRGNNAGSPVAWTPAQRKAIETVMLMWALPDKVPPLRIGRMGGVGSHATQLHDDVDQNWSPANGEPPNTTGILTPAVNELWAYICHKDPNCGIIYNEYRTSRYTFGGTLEETLTPGPIVMDSGQDADGAPIVFFSAAELGVGGTGFWSDGRLPTATGTTTSPSTVTFSLGNPAVWANTSSYVFQITVFQGKVLQQVEEKVVPGTGTADLVITLPDNPGRVFISYLGAFVTASGDDDVALADTAVSMNYLGPDLRTDVPGQWHVRHLPLPSDAADKGDCGRINAARLICTPSPAALSADGLVADIILDDGQLPDTVFLDVNTARFIPSVFDRVSNFNQRQKKELAGVDPGASDCWHPSSIEDFEVDSFDENSDLPGWANSSVNLEDLTGGVFIVARNGRANPGGRAGQWQFFWHYEFRTQSDQTYPMLPPQIDPLILEEAAARFERFQCFSGNPDHVAETVRKIFRTTGRVAGPTAQAAGLALMATPGGQLPGALIAGGGALATILAELLKP